MSYPNLYATKQPHADNYCEDAPYRHSIDDANNFNQSSRTGAEPDHYYLMNRRQQMAQLDQENDSSGLGAPPDINHIGINDGSIDMDIMVRGSITSIDNQYRDVRADPTTLLTKSSDDLTLDMLGPSAQNVITLMPPSLTGLHQDLDKNMFLPQITTKNPPSSALNLHANRNHDSRANLRAQQQNPHSQQSSEPALSLEQYRQNNANLSRILMQFDSTPQFNQMPPTTHKNADSAPTNTHVAINQRNQLNKMNNPSSSDTLNEVSQFNYIQPSGLRVKPEAADQIEKIRDNLSKIELLQQAIHTQPNTNSQQSSQGSQRRTGASGLQAAGLQIMQNENKNQANQPQAQQPANYQLKIDKAKSVPIPDQNMILDQHKKIMSHFDDIPIQQIKSMVGYQTNQEMYKSDAKLPEEPDGAIDPKQFHLIKENAPTGDGSDESEGEEAHSLEERVFSTKWKVRMRAYKEVNQLFYNDYAKSQSDPEHPLQSFEQIGPLIQEMIKDTNLVNAFEALQCLHSYVRFAPEIKQVAFACHIYLLEKVNTSKTNFRDITMKIITCMLRRLQGPSNTILPELLKRFKSKNAKSATFCLQVVLEVFKTKEQVIIQEINIRQLFKSIQSGLTHQGKEIREAAYNLLKHICERCKDEPQTIVANCQNLRPVQVKEFTEELAKIEKMPSAILSLFDESQEERDPETKKSTKQAELKTEVVAEQHKPVQEHHEVVDLLSLIPEDFSEIQYAPQINTKKRSMEQFNSELQKTISNNSIVKVKDYQMLTNVVFHMLEDKNMLVFMEAIKSVELLTTLQQLKKEKIKPFITLLAGKYGETKTAVIAQTDKAMAAIVKHSLTPVQFADTIVNQVAVTHKNPRVKQLLLTNALSQMLQTCDSVSQVFKSIQKNLLALILKDNNDQVRNAAVAVVIEIGMLQAADESFSIQIQAFIQQLPKARIAEINRKLLPSEPAEQQPLLSKTMVQPKTQQMTVTDEPIVSDEFSKTLEPTKQVLPGQFYQSLMKLIRNLPANTQSRAQLAHTFQEALQSNESFGVLIKNRILICKAMADCLARQSKGLADQKEQVLLIVDLVKQLFMHDVDVGIAPQLTDLQDFTQMALLLHTLQLDQELGLTSQLLVLGLEASNDTLGYLEMLRTAVESQVVIESPQALKIIQNVYLWLGLKIEDFLRSGLGFQDIEELRGIGIKYLEATQLFNEKQRQALIQSMLRFKDQIQTARQEQLQTLGQLQTHRTDDSQLDTKQQTAQFNQSQMESARLNAQPAITGELICQTIDREFEQGLLMFKELAQSPSHTLDFETKQMIFVKLLAIVSEGPTLQTNHQQQQYRQAYALKALMWMKEETMGLEDTYKLSSPILSIYLQQVQSEGDASVEMYLLNFWVKELSIRDLCDRIQHTVSMVKTSRTSARRQSAMQSSDEQLSAFKVLFQWLCEHKLETQEWKLQDLRKVALLICESVLSKQFNQACKQFMKKCVERDSKEKVLEFMEIQLMHSNEVFLQFLDWFQKQYPSSSQPKIDLGRVQPSAADALLSERSSDKQPLSYVERRQQMKQSQLKQTNAQQQSDQQIREAITKIQDESLHYQSSQLQQQSLVEESHEQHSLMQEVKPQSSHQERRSRYEQQFLQSIADDESPEEVKEQPQCVTSAHQRSNSELQERVFQSEAKQRDWVKKIIELEGEKRRIEAETNQLKMQSNQESKLYQQKLAAIQQEHHQVIQNLGEVNQCYQQQVDENEKLKQQLSNMQRQHQEMITRFEQIERKINSREEHNRSAQTVIQPPQTPPRSGNQRRDQHLMNSVAKLQRISDTFSVNDQQIGITRIQELLLSVERNVDGELAKPLITHYQRFRSVDERLSLIAALGEALSLNEDVLLALSVDVYKAMLNFLLRAFAHEKERLDTQSMGREKQEQNQVTMESQKLVSRLLNSKDFTTSLVSLFQLLREAMPIDLRPQLAVEDGQYLRVVMRCINRITKALHSESSDLIRGFDVLLEMQKIFVICPPENLREELPSLQDFDFVFRGMKDVSDKFIELQPEKVQSFLGYCETRGEPENAFMKYLRMKTQ